MSLNTDSYITSSFGDIKKSLGVMIFVFISSLTHSVLAWL